VGYDPPRLLPVGDAALAVQFGSRIDPAINVQVHALARALAEHPQVGLGEAVPAYCSLLLHYDPLVLSFSTVVALVQEAMAQTRSRPSPEPRVVEIPTCYGGEFGPDLAGVARHNGLSEEAVVELHSSRPYPVYMLGFSPGFAYLGGLPPAIAAPRLATPRIRVPAGSVGIAGAQTGIYPLATPGGWQLIGRTPLRLFDPERDPPARLHPGDRVRFVPVSSDRFASLHEQEWEAGATSRPRVAPAGAGGLEVLEPGLLTTVQDAGRRGYERFGVPVAGAMDRFALRAANQLVGNPPESAGLEITLNGPVLRAETDCLIGLGGADLGLRINDQPIPPWMSAYVRRGWKIAFAGRRSGCRAYMAVAGGIEVPPVMGSRATYLHGGFGGFGGRPLQAGDRLGVGRVDWHLASGAGRRLQDCQLPGYGEHPTVRFIRGPQSDAFTAEGWQTFISEEYLVSATADRMGYRLQGPAILRSQPDDLISDGIVLGAVQVPADGQPIVMMADRPTTGGYPKIGVVAGADIPLLAQCLPGASRIRFRETTVGEAHASLRRMLQGLRWRT